jgi:hypothetical protein
MRTDEEATRPAPPVDVRSEEHVSAELASVWRRLRLAQVARWTGALLCLLAAPLMVFVPGVPGPPFVVLALLLVAPDLAVARRLAVRMQRKVPFVRRFLPRRLRNLTKKERR